MTEEWRAVPAYPNYQVSDLGRVRGRNGLKTATQVRDGYWRVGLCRNGHRLTFSVHRLVLGAFVGPCPVGMEGCHEDDNHDDNRLSNLRWDTPKANSADRAANGRTARGEGSGVAKLTEPEIVAIRAARGRQRQVDLAARFGVDQTHISRIQRGEAWAHV